MSPRILILLIIFLSIINTHPITGNQDEFEIDKMEHLINLENKTWNTTLFIKINENWKNTEFNLIFPAELQIESTKINNTPSPTRVKFDDESTIISITSTIKIEVFDLIIIKFEGILIYDLVQTSEDLNLFRYFIGLNYHVQALNVSITLPKLSAISSEKEQLNVFPSEYNITSDGQSISIHWVNLYLVGDVKSIIIEFESYQIENIDNSVKPDNFKQLTLGIFIGIIFSAFAMIIVLKYFDIPIRKVFSQNSMSFDDTQTRIVTVVKPIILKPHLKNILSILLEYDDGLLQNELVDLLNLSKSRVSQYLKELEDIKIITREKVGRGNMIYLKVEIDLK